VLTGSLTRVLLILILRWLDENLPYRILTGKIVRIDGDYNKDNPRFQQSGTTIA
jgi:hypothetical protein